MDYNFKTFSHFSLLILTLFQESRISEWWRVVESVEGKCLFLFQHYILKSVMSSCIHRQKCNQIFNFSPYWSPKTSSPPSAAVAEFDSVTLVCDFNLAPDEQLHSVVWYWKQGALKKKKPQIFPLLLRKSYSLVSLAARLKYSFPLIACSPRLAEQVSNERVRDELDSS